MNVRRLEKIKEMVRIRQHTLAIILENVSDLHNLGAVMRSADSVGALDVFVLINDPNIIHKKFKLGKRTSAGTRRWLNVYAFRDTQACFEAVRQKYDKIYATHLAENSVSLYEVDLCERVALLFGSEKNGVTKEALDLCDGNFIIPQMGMAQSLNVSVAAAVTLYEAYRQRREKGMYDQNVPQSIEEQEALLEVYLERCKVKDDRFAKDG